MAANETVSGYLREGDLYFDRAIFELDSEAIKKAKEIYDKCNAILVNEKSPYTPLSYASSLGLYYMVRGFLKCARQTGTNLHNGHVGEFQEFLEHRNSEGDTALHIAARQRLTNSEERRKENVKIIRILLCYTSCDSLTAKNGDGKTPLSYLHGLPEFDDAIFVGLKGEMRVVVNAPGATVILIDDEQQSDMSVLGINLEKTPTGSSEKQELIDYNETVMELTTYKLSHKHKSLKDLDHGELELSPDKNTILHIAAMLGDVECVKAILQRHPSLIERRNLEGETPAYVAAREGHWKIIEIIIGHLKRKEIDIVKHMTRSKDNETALLTAIRNHQVVVVFLLTKQVPTLANHINDFEESPLYIAALKGYDAILGLMLEKCIDIAYGGPNGETALHAASNSGSIDCIHHLLASNSGLIYTKDARGWTALHIAASRGHRIMVKYFIEDYPGCQEITCGKGRNVLHTAVENEQEKLIEFMFGHEQHELLTSRLMNQKDSDGNTPIHLLVASNLEMPHIVKDHRVDLTAINNKKQTPLRMTSSKEKRERLLQKDKPSNPSNPSSQKPSLRDPIPDLEQSGLHKEAQKAFDMADNVVLVATLIATATFAAAFTVPGGFDGNEGSKQGMPILLKKAAFQAFIITNTLAFSCSCAVLLGHMMILLKRYILEATKKEDIERIRKRLFIMYLLVSVAMVSMVIAFMTGVFVVLMPSPRLAIPLCAICLFIMFLSTLFATKIAEWLYAIMDSF